MASAQRILEELRKNKVTHVAGLPDNSSAKLFDMLARSPDVRLVSVTREGEAFAIAAGLWIGGAKPVVLVQNTGLFESGDSYRGTIMRMRIPLVSLVTYRGYSKMKESRFGPGRETPDAAALSRADLDSAALITEPTLEAWGMPFEFLHDDEDVAKISRAFRTAEKHEQPYAILITGELT